MNSAGIDVAVLALTTPGVQNLNSDVAIHSACFSNDELAAAVREFWKVLNSVTVTV